MKKNILKVTGVAVAVLLAGILALTFSLDGLVKSTIEEASSEVLKTEVYIDGVSVSILDGSGDIDGWIIQNPEGFADRPAISFKKISVKIDLSTLLSDTVVVSSVDIQEPEIYMEQNPTVNNLKTLQDNLEQYSSDDPGRGSLVINHVLIEKGRVIVKAKVGEGHTIQAEIDRIELTDVGSEGSNTTEQTVKQVLEPIIKQAVSTALKKGIQNAVEGAVQDLLEGG